MDDAEINAARRKIRNKHTRQIQRATRVYRREVEVCWALFAGDATATGMAARRDRLQQAKDAQIKAFDYADNEYNAAWQALYDQATEVQRGEILWRAKFPSYQAKERAIS
jgi:hypothetical protein